MDKSKGELLTILRTKIPEQFMEIRREIRGQDVKKLELSFLKMNKLLLRIGFKQELLPALPTDCAVLSEEEWSDVREEVKLLELVLEKLAEGLPVQSDESLNEVEEGEL